jgi:hypothetical protein
VLLFTAPDEGDEQMSAELTEFTIGVLADDETVERMRLALLAVLENGEFRDLPWTFSVSPDPDLRGR